MTPSPRTMLVAVALAATGLGLRADLDPSREAQVLAVGSGPAPPLASSASPAPLESLAPPLGDVPSASAAPLPARAAHPASAAPSVETSTGPPYSYGTPHTTVTGTPPADVVAGETVVLAVDTTNSRGNVSIVTVKWGDGTDDDHEDGVPPCVPDPGPSSQHFDIRHTFAAAGSYDIVVDVEAVTVCNNPGYWQLAYPVRWTGVVAVGPAAPASPTPSASDTPSPGPSGQT